MFANFQVTIDGISCFALSLMAFCVTFLLSGQEMKKHLNVVTGSWGRL